MSRKHPAAAPATTPGPQRIQNQADAAEMAKPAIQAVKDLLLTSVRESRQLARTIQSAQRSQRGSMLWALREFRTTVAELRRDERRRRQARARRRR